jgi:hypothetical protein
VNITTVPVCHSNERFTYFLIDESSTFVRILRWIGLIAAAISSWVAAWVLIVPLDVGAESEFFAPMRILAYLTFVGAPLLTFLPIARLLSIPLYDLEAVTAWSTLLFMITFINPGSHPPFPVLLTVLISLMMSLATIFTLVSYAVGYRLLTRRSQKYDFLRARREGYLAAMFLVGLLLLHLLEVLSMVNGALLALIIVLLEVFLLSRGSRSQSAHQESSGSSRSIGRQPEPS